MKLGNYKIGTRLAASFGVMLCIVIGVAGVGINRMGEMEQRMQDIISVNDVESSLATEMRATVDDRMIALRNVVLLQTDEEMQPEAERVKRQSGKYANYDAELRGIFSKVQASSDEAAALEKADTAAKASEPIVAKVLKLGLANDNDAATRVLIKELRPVQNQWTAALTELVNIEVRQNREAVEQAHVAYTHAWMALLGITVCAVAFGAWIAYAITRGIIVPIQSAVKVAQNVAAGNLANEVQITGRDETAELLQALDEMNGRLHRVVHAVRESAASVATASSEIATGNMDLSRRTESQAGSLEETASAMEELTSTVRQNAENAAQANTLAGQASTVANQGGQVVSRVVSTMQSISDASKRISEIIGVIDGIAFQTNILALNAAVEAARAGEQGRGFAVVATEVRSLAHRSATAAKEIKALIDDSVGQVHVGRQLAEDAGTTMQQVVDSVNRVTNIIGEIAQASREQSSGITQVNDAVVGLDQTTQQNAALVEEAAAAAAALQEQAQALTAEVGFFQLERQPQQGRPVRQIAPQRVVRLGQTVSGTRIASAR
ncbi:HAMP domain-containing protein [Duganella sp. CY15W]|uniref:methyl-accepting chemotaxis protein n=1 Tax=Duganella sp. CY15W TaxID=2692172 RepID=UPI001369FC21|nr:methyl-accepting chemotaxis protein [Duganella sp. CY15W]MYM28682.1 HAMP domain-containing protein [Duganella sp. CY15W]